jgi:hypothetical protein
MRANWGPNYFLRNLAFNGDVDLLAGSEGVHSGAHPHVDLSPPLPVVKRRGVKKEFHDMGARSTFEGPKTYQDHQGDKQKLYFLIKFFGAPMALRIGLPGSSGTAK